MQHYKKVEQKTAEDLFTHVTHVSVTGGML